MRSVRVSSACRQQAPRPAAGELAHSGSVGHCCGNGAPALVLIRSFPRSLQGSTSSRIPLFCVSGPEKSEG